LAILSGILGLSPVILGEPFALCHSERSEESLAQSKLSDRRISVRTGSAENPSYCSGQRLETLRYRSG